MAKWLRGAVLALLAISALTRTATAQTQTAVEYFHAGWSYYFVTSFPAEISALDSGAFGGVWQRTGQTFPVWAAQEASTSPVCRFFSTSFAPRSSHFYTPFPGECNAVKNNQDWQYEAISFYLKTPDGIGNCPAGSAPLYRLYNNGIGGAPNHRYTTSTTIASQMRAAGWVPEGFGAAGVLACIPSTTTSAGTAEGLWVGSTSRNQTVLGAVLNTGEYYVLYTSPGSNYIAGAVHGNATSSGGQFTSSNARDFNIAGYGVANGAVAGTYVAHSSIGGTLVTAYGSSSFTAAYQAIYDQPVSMSSVAGTFSGTVFSSVGYDDAVVTINASGGFAGAVTGCSFSGTATRRGNTQIINLSISFQGLYCLFSSLQGIAYYDAPSRTLYAAALNAGRTDGFLFVGSK